MPPFHFHVWVLGCLGGMGVEMVWIVGIVVDLLSYMLVQKILVVSKSRQGHLVFHCLWLSLEGDGNVKCSTQLV